MSGDVNINYCNFLYNKQYEGHCDCVLSGYKELTLQILWHHGRFQAILQTHPRSGNQHQQPLVLALSTNPCDYNNQCVNGFSGADIGM